MIRELVTKLSSVFERNSHHLRKKCDAPVRIAFEPVRTTGNLHTTMEGLAISGEAVDISKGGIGFIVSAIRIKEFYLVGQDQTLIVELDLPAGKVKFKAIGRRYNRVGPAETGEKYFVGAEITEISGRNKQLLEEYLRFGASQAGTASASLEMGN
jgi:c-di-GMP-binding flagellar brake protein YcgR